MMMQISNEARFSKQGPCEGDSGGPLYYHETTLEGNSRLKLGGVVAGGIGCGKNIPTWYTRVSI